MQDFERSKIASTMFTQLKGHRKRRKKRHLTGVQESWGPTRLLSRYQVRGGRIAFCQGLRKDSDHKYFVIILSVIIISTIIIILFH